MRLLWHDFRYGWRTLRNSPGFAALTVLTLALGIAVNTTVFSWIHAVLLSPLPGTHTGGRLVAVESNERSGEGHNISYPDYRDYRDHSKSLEGITVTWDLLAFLRRAARSRRARTWRNGGIRLLRGAGSAPGIRTLVRGQGVRRSGRLVSCRCDRRRLLAQVFPWRCQGCGSRGARQRPRDDRDWRNSAGVRRGNSGRQCGFMGPHDDGRGTGRHRLGLPHAARVPTLAVVRAAEAGSHAGAGEWRDASAGGRVGAHLPGDEPAHERQTAAGKPSQRRRAGVPGRLRCAS